MLIEILALYLILLPVLIALAIGGYCADKIEENVQSKKKTKIKIDYK